MLLKDSRGDKTVTLTILIITWVVITIKFMFGNADGVMLPISGSEYALAMTPFLALFGHREHDKRK